MPADSQSLRRVLFVDDNPEFLDLIKELMNAFSGGQWEISTAESASRAFAVLQDQPVDLVVIDVQMGVMDGVQLLSLLNRGYPNVQKVVLTGLASDKYRAACLSNGAELFLEKPTTEDGWGNLFTALNEVVRLKPEEGFRGVLRRVGIQDVLQMECLARSSSVLEIANAQTQGRIFVETGQIVHAQAGNLTGEEAFNLLLGMSGGQFNLKPFVEPPARSISGAWEFLLMEAARQRDEATEAQPAAPMSATDTAMLVATAEQIIARSEPLPPLPEPPPAPTASPMATPETTAKVFRPKVEEFLVCSMQGEVLHEWQCPNTDLWVSFFEFVSQRAQRLGQALPLGEFDRLEIQSDDTRAVVIISTDKAVLVKTRKGPVAG